MAYIRFIVAPNWFMKLLDTDVLNSKTVLEIYQYKQSSQISHLVKSGRMPPPDVVTVRPRRNRIGWSVGYLKNYLKLPTELIEVKKEDKEK